MDAFEQRAGKVAQVMGSSLEVRKFSRTMVDEHARNAQALMDAVSRAQVPAPTFDVTAAQTGTVKDLYAVAPRDFDRTYMTGEVASHQDALEVAHRQHRSEAGTADEEAGEVHGARVRIDRPVNRPGASGEVRIGR